MNVIKNLSNPEVQSSGNRKKRKRDMCILMKKIKSIIIVLTAIIITLTGLTPCFAKKETPVFEMQYFHEYDLMKKQKELTVYEQYLKDYAEHIRKIYTPEKFFPQKNMELDATMCFEIYPDGSIKITWSNNPPEYYMSDDPFWLFKPIYYRRLPGISRKHEQYVKELLINNPAKPFPEDFGEYIYGRLNFSHRNNWFRKPIFTTNIKIDYFGRHNNFSGNIIRSNYTSGK